MGSVSASNEKVVCRNVCFKRLISKIPSEKKRFDRPTRLLPGSVGSFYVRVADVFIVLLYM